MPICNFNLSFFADLASILTAVVAVGWFALIECDKYKKKKKLEDYLYKKWLVYKAHPDDRNHYRHSIIHLMTELGLTSDEVLHASFRSKKLLRRAGKDKETGMATDIRLQHSDAEDF